MKRKIQTNLKATVGSLRDEAAKKGEVYNMRAEAARILEKIQTIRCQLEKNLAENTKKFAYAGVIIWLVTFASGVYNSSIEAILRQGTSEMTLLGQFCVKLIVSMSLFVLVAAGLGGSTTIALVSWQKRKERAIKIWRKNTKQWLRLAVTLSVISLIENFYYSLSLSKFLGDRAGEASFVGMLASNLISSASILGFIIMGMSLVLMRMSLKTFGQEDENEVKEGELNEKTSVDQKGENEEMSFRKKLEANVIDAFSELVQYGKRISWNLVWSTTLGMTIIGLLKKFYDIVISAFLECKTGEALCPIGKTVLWFVIMFMLVGIMFALITAKAFGKENENEGMSFKKKLEANAFDIIYVLFPCEVLLFSSLILATTACIAHIVSWADILLFGVITLGTFSILGGLYILIRITLIGIEPTEFEMEEIEESFESVEEAFKREMTKTEMLINKYRYGRPSAGGT